jgi:hypothetical protein
LEEEVGLSWQAPQFGSGKKEEGRRKADVISNQQTGNFAVSNGNMYSISEPYDAGSGDTDAGGLTLMIILLLWVRWRYLLFSSFFPRLFSARAV